MGFLNRYSETSALWTWLKLTYTKSQLGSEDLWCLFETSKAFRYYVAPMLLRKAKIGFDDSDRVSLNGRLLHPRIAYGILMAWAPSVQILKYRSYYSYVPFQMIELLAQLVNMKYFRYARSLNVLLSVRMRGDRPANCDQHWKPSPQGEPSWYSSKGYRPSEYPQFESMVQSSRYLETLLEYPKATLSGD